MDSAQMTHMTSDSHSQSSSSGYWFILLIALTEIFIGIGVFIAGIWRKIAISLGIALALIFWIIGESLGGYYTGLATDPNSGPLLILLALSILGCMDLDKKLTKLTKSLATKIVGQPSTSLS
jgi:hypothetical protein